MSEQTHQGTARSEEDLSRIGSMTEVDDHGRPEVHGAGYYLAKLDLDTATVKHQLARLSEQVAALSVPSGRRQDTVPAQLTESGRLASPEEPGLPSTGTTAAPRSSSRTYARDLLERILSTFIQSFIGGIIITQPLNRSMWYAALAGGVGAVLALLKGLFARSLGDQHSASLSRRV